MDARYALTLLSVVVLALIVGVAVAQHQPRTAAAPAPTSTPTPLPAPAPGSVNIVGNSANPNAVRYVPSTLTVHVGQKVTWVNDSVSNQTATADGGAFDTGVLSVGQSATWTPNKAGRYAYSSFLQPDLQGVIVVQP